MNIRQCRGSCDLAIQSIPCIVPASQAIFLAVGMLVPATDRRGLGAAKERSPVCNEEAERLRAERNAKRRARYLVNREKVLARTKAYKAANLEKQRAYHLANREKVLARTKAYYAANREKIRASQTAYHEANQEKRKVADKAYHAANREKRLADMAARRAARKQPQ